MIKLCILIHLQGLMEIEIYSVWWVMRFFRTASRHCDKFLLIEKLSELKFSNNL